MQTTGHSDGFSAPLELHTIFLIDDKSLTNSQRKAEVSEAIALNPSTPNQQNTCTADIYLLNRPHAKTGDSLGGYTGLKSFSSLQEILHNIQPAAAYGDPIDERMDQILNAYIAKLEDDQGDTLSSGFKTLTLKQLDIVVVTHAALNLTTQTKLASIAEKFQNKTSNSIQLSIQYLKVGCSPVTTSNRQPTDEVQRSTQGPPQKQHQQHPGPINNGSDKEPVPPRTSFIKYLASTMLPGMTLS